MKLKQMNCWSVGRQIPWEFQSGPGEHIKYAADKVDALEGKYQYHPLWYVMRNAKHHGKNVAVTQPCVFAGSERATVVVAVCKQRSLNFVKKKVSSGGHNFTARANACSQTQQ